MNGSCLCGGVRFTTKGQPRPVIICHCSQCRKQSGHCWAATALPENALHLTKADSLAWYAASDRAKRGFCSNCGAFLFWQATGSDQISFAAGAIDGPTGLTVAEEWYLGDAGDHSDADPILHGSCLCGANQFSIPGPMGEVSACHCQQCRKTSGHFAASFDVDAASVSWTARLTRDHISPGGGVRSFCPTCGSKLIFRKTNEVSLEVGVFDNPVNAKAIRHTYVDEKGDYYTLTDSLPLP